MEDKELIMMLEIGEGKMAFQNAGNDLEIWDLLPVLGRPRLGGRVVDLRTCSPNIWKTSENTTFPGKREGVGDPTNHNSSHARTPEAESGLSPEDTLRGHCKTWG